MLILGQQVLFSEFTLQKIKKYIYLNNLKYNVERN